MDLRLFYFHMTNCPSSNYSSIQPSVFQWISYKNVISDSENLPIRQIQAAAPAVPDMFKLLSLYHHILHIYSHQNWPKGRFEKGVSLKINLTGTDNIIFFWLHDFEKSYQPIYQGAVLTKFVQLVPLETVTIWSNSKILYSPNLDNKHTWPFHHQWLSLFTSIT